jgi:hypothetical protein
MATLEKTLPEVEKCRCLLQGTAKNLADRLYGPDGPPPGTSFSHLEATVDRLMQSVRKQVLDLLLSRQSAAFHQALPADLRLCPSCGRDTLPKDPEPRLLHSRAGMVEWLEPQRYCSKCRKAFFPQSKSLGIDQGHYSPSLLNLICYAGANKTSFREASVDLLKLATVAVHEKQVERISKRIGAERLAERDQQAEHFLGLPLVERCENAPEGVNPPGPDQVAVVMADAGMLQLRGPAEQGSAESASSVSAPAQTPRPEEAEGADVSSPNEADASHSRDKNTTAVDTTTDRLEDAEGDDDYDQEKPPSGRHWREDKVGLVLTMRSKTSASDPCPEIPDTFLDHDRVTKIVRGMKKSASLSTEDQQEGQQQSEEAEESQEGIEEAAEYQGPELQKRQVVASRQSWPLFGALLAMAAWQAGFAKANRKAFVADGARAIWRVWKKRFASHVPILDFIHAMSYVYSAAKAVGEDAVHGWGLYDQWIAWTWQGNVSLVIEKLEQWQAEHGKPQKGEGQTSVRSVVAKSLGYLKNNKDKMKYDEYRKAGLPIVSSLVESMVKQISRRVKGTEKFWTDEGAEAILQLRADYLSDGEVMERFWERRQAAANGQRSYRSKS